MNKVDTIRAESSDQVREIKEIIKNQALSQVNNIFSCVLHANPFCLQEATLLLLHVVKQFFLAESVFSNGWKSRIHVQTVGKL